MSRILILAIGCRFALSTVAPCWGGTYETQSNPLPDGRIEVADGDPDRSDWEGIPWYEEDDDLDELYPVDIGQLQVAHDSQNVYFHLTSLAWDTEETWRVGTFVDVDDDPTTGYTGGWLAVGADRLIEGASVFSFNAATQAEWGWEWVADLPRDQTSMRDVEVAVPRVSLGNPEAINFLLFANNALDFSLPDDIYPNTAGSPTGDSLRYELTDPVSPGDFDGNGTLDRVDVNALNAQIAAQMHAAAFDLNGDALVDDADLTVWVSDLKRTWFGDADLNGVFDSSDLVDVFQPGKFETESAATWEEGDWTGDLRFGTDDLVRAFQDGGFEEGPRPAALRAVPEPGGGLLWLLGMALGSRWRRR